VCVFVCVCVHVRACVCVMCVHAFIHACINVRECVHVNLYRCVHICKGIHVLAHAFLCVLRCICTYSLYERVCMCAHMFVCVVFV
jgi:hypothetical protein